MSLAANDPAIEGVPSGPNVERAGCRAAAKSRCLVVLGMHRSGTSATTRVVNLLGADLSQNLIPPNPSNVTGFWESRSINQIHNELLREFGLMWQDYLPLPAGWEKSEAARKAKTRLLEYLDSEFSGSGLFTVKDPRICRLLPLWLEALKEFDAEPLFLFCYRNPLEVAASLHAMHGMPSETSLLLWMRSYIEAEEATRGCRRLFIAYDDLIGDWRSVITRMTGHFELDWPRSMKEAALEIEDFLSDTHRHHTVMDFERVDDAETRALIQSMYHALQESPEDPDRGLRRFARRAMEHLDRKSDVFAPVLKHERKAQFKLQTEKARAQRFNRRLQWKLKDLKRRAREQKQRMKLAMILSIVAALALGFAGGYLLANRNASPPSPASSERNGETREGAIPR